VSDATVPWASSKEQLVAHQQQSVREWIGLGLGPARRDSRDCCLIE
jgi:hypothetical protein